MGTMWAKICCAPNHWHSTKNAGDVENLNNGKKKRSGGVILLLLESDYQNIRVSPTATDELNRVCSGDGLLQERNGNRRAPILG
jgi:hypothetical protein